MKISYRAALSAVAIISVAAAAACGGSDATSPAPTVLPAAVETLKNSLAAYSSLKLAKDAGYSTMITDCMSNGDEGAMGVHFGNTTFIDGTADAAHPEVLIYEPGTNGEMSLVGVEFLVPYTLVPKTSTPPVLFDQKFSQNDVFGVWALHVWTHRSNPSGLFASWNPRVHC
ncbi:MAG: hypothetical protein ABJE47_06115 [bacterium]